MAVHLSQAVAAAALAAACSGEARPDPPGMFSAGGTSPAGSGGGAASSGSGGSAARAPASDTCDLTARGCEGPGHETPVVSQAFERLEAVLVDIDGAPLADVQATACGKNLCLYGSSEATGYVLIHDPRELVRPAFKYGGGDYARLALLLGPGPAYDLGEQATARLAKPDATTPVGPGETFTSAGISLGVPSGTTVTLDCITYDEVRDRAFRAVVIPIDRAPAAVDASLGFELVVATSPVGTRFCPAAALRVPNEPKWDAGAPVEIFVHGIEIDEQWAPYAGWAKVSEGRVSEDGQTIATDAGGGVPILSVFGVRKKP